jgi:uncharacterized membrane protein
MSRLLPSIVLPILLLAYGTLLAQAAPTPVAGKASTAGDVEEIEDVQAVEVVQTPARAGGDAVRGGWADIAGRFHNAVVHLPIGWLLMVLLLDVLAFVLRRKELESAGLWVLGGALLSFVPGVATGLLREDFVAQTSEVQKLITTHATLIFVTAGLATAAFLWRILFGKDLSGAKKGVYLALIASAAVLVGIAGHWGGKIAWGIDYLPF